MALAPTGGMDPSGADEVMETGLGEATLAAETAGARVLIVDDEPLLAGTLKRALSAKYAVVVAMSGGEALERVAMDGPFDVMVCDMTMPDLTGAEVYAELLQLAPYLAEGTIFITGAVLTRRAREFLNSIPNRWMEKPFSAESLRLAVRSLVQARRMRSECGCGRDRAGGPQRRAPHSERRWALFSNRWFATFRAPEKRPTVLGWASTSRRSS